MAELSRQEKEAFAMDAVLKARHKLLLERKFYGVLVSKVEPVIAWDQPTAATDSKKHYWNPDFVAKQSPKKLLGTQVHESEHDARLHGWRRNGRDPNEWNICCDYAINIDLIDEGFELPDGALIDPKYRGMSAEEIFRCRELDRKRQQPPPPPPQEEGDDDEGEEGLDDADVNPPQGKPDANDDEESDDADDDLSEETSPDNGEGDEAPEGAEEGAEEGDDGEGGDTPGDDGDEASEAGSEAGEGAEGEGDDAEGEGEGEGEGKANGKGQPGAEGQGHGGQSDDPGGCGGVLDSVSDEGQSAEEAEADWTRDVRIAAAVAKGRGQCPGHVSRDIEAALNPPRDWRDELREFCEAGNLRVETWNRPNKRFAGRGLTLPSSQRDGVAKAVLLVDTSGSCDDVALALVRNETQAMLDDGIIDQMVVVYGDTRVTRVDQFQHGDELEFDPRGGGGTDMKPLFRFVAEEHDDAAVVICFTDLEIGDAGPEPHCPVLFAVHGYPHRVKQLCENAPWQSTAIDVGAH